MTASELVRRLKAIRHEIEMDRINEAVCTPPPYYPPKEQAELPLSAEAI